MMEAIFSSDASVLARATRCHIPEDGLLQERKAYPDLNGVYLTISEL
jgi:hypothetical protein